MLAKTRLVVRGVKRSRLRVLGAVVVEIPDFICHQGNQTADIVPHMPRAVGGGDRGLP